MLKRQLRIAAGLTLVFTLITGLVYPLAVTGIAQLVFPGAANGSLIWRNGRVVGSELIGQPFSDPGYFWGRISATSPYPYNASSSTGSNLGPLNPALMDAVQKRIHDLKAVDSTNVQPIPADLVTASGSGLDPHISTAAALYQVPRVARIRQLSENDVRSLVERHTSGRFLGVFGEPAVNVLELNLDLDARTGPGGN